MKFNLKSAALLLITSLPLTSMDALRSLPQTLTATTTRKTLCGLLLLYTAHEGYRYWCHKAHSERARLQPAPAPVSHKETVIIALHGLADNENFFDTYAREGFFPANTPIVRVSFDDALSANLVARYKQAGEIPWNDLYKARRTDIGQNFDMEQLHAVMQRYVDKNIILVGASRGASLALNYVALKKPDNVHGIIAEAPFDDLQNVARQHLSTYYLGWLPVLPGMINLGCAALFKHYSTYGISPRDVIAHIPHHVRVLLACSEKDKLIPAANTQKLFDALQKAGHPNCKLLTTKSGSHTKIISDADGELYKKEAAEFFAECRK